MRTHEPYFKARLRELRDLGLAKPRERIYVPPAPSYVHLVQRIAQRFQRELARHHVMDVFWVAAEERVTIRRVELVHSRTLPVGAVYMGRYRYPHATPRFVDDLIIIIAKGTA